MLVEGVGETPAFAFVGEPEAKGREKIEREFAARHGALGEVGLVGQPRTVATAYAETRDPTGIGRRVVAVDVDRTAGFRVGRSSRPVERAIRSAT